MKKMCDAHATFTAQNPIILFHSVYKIIASKAFERKRNTKKADKKNDFFDFKKRIFPNLAAFKTNSNQY